MNEKELKEENELLRRSLEYLLSPNMAIRQANAWYRQKGYDYQFSTEPLDTKLYIGHWESTRNDNFQRGRAYECDIAKELIDKEYEVADASGKYSWNDLGRDLIAQRQDRHLVIQCKYHENVGFPYESLDDVLYILATSIIYAFKKMNFIDYILNNPDKGDPLKEQWYDLKKVEYAAFLSEAKVKPVLFSTQDIELSLGRIAAELGVTYIKTDKDGKWEGNLLD